MRCALKQLWVFVGTRDPCEAVSPLDTRGLVVVAEAGFEPATSRL